MSEYQYYEFRAIDRPLTDKEMAALRAISTRARITPMEFVNRYDFGDLKADPSDLLLKYFDAHVYFASFRVVSFMIRLPESAVDASAIRAFVANECLRAVQKNGFWLVAWDIDESEEFARFVEEDGSEWMSQLAPIRDELIQGDFRSLYIGWLAGAAWRIEEGVEDEFEPMALAGLGELTAAQKALAEFLEIDGDILAGVAAGSPSRESSAANELVDEFIGTLSTRDVRAFAAASLRGEGQRAGVDFRARFASWRQAQEPAPELAPRSLAVLHQLARNACEERQKKESAAKARAEAKRDRERQKRLAKLADDFPKGWRLVESIAKSGSASGYDACLDLLVDLAEAYTVHATRAAFDEAFAGFVKEHSRRTALTRRLKQAKLLG